MDSSVHVNEVALASRLREVPTRVLHGLRRRAALAALRRRPRVTSLLVVCHGNLCRSPFAAALLRASLAVRGVRVDSAGLSGTGRRSSPEAVVAAARFGIKQVVLPDQNQSDWTEVPAEVRQKLKVHFIRHISELLPLTLREK